MHVQVAESYVDIIEKLHGEWTPHAGQIKVGRAAFRDGKRSIFVQCGRKWGKTEIAAYICWRIAQSIPDAACYFIGPQQKQTREIVWASKRMQGFGPPEWLSGKPNDTEMRVNFINGSFIKVDGSDNHDSYRGVEYDVCIYEEFKDQDKRFYDAMHPNASVRDGIDVFIGSPPEGDEESGEAFLEMAEEHRADPDKFFHEAPTWENPIISIDWLKKEKTRLYRRGDGDDWEREYAAKVIKGGKKAIFPMIHNYPITNHRAIVHRIIRDLRKLEWYTIADPGSATCFAVLLAAVNPYTKEIYLLDEIYETTAERTTTRVVGEQIIEKQNELAPERGNWTADWLEVCDEAATWFINEMGDRFEHWFGTTEKAKHDKKSGLSLIKDLLLDGKVVISDRCVNLIKEMKAYKKLESGQIPKKDDHLIDCFRYLLGAAGYSVETVQEPAEREKSEDFRGARMEDDFPQLREFENDGVADLIG